MWNNGTVTIHNKPNGTITRMVIQRSADHALNETQNSWNHRRECWVRKHGRQRVNYCSTWDGCSSEWVPGPERCSTVCSAFSRIEPRNVSEQLHFPRSPRSRFLTGLLVALYRSVATVQSRRGTTLVWPTFVRDRIFYLQRRKYFIYFSFEQFFQAFDKIWTTVNYMFVI